MELPGTGGSARASPTSLVPRSRLLKQQGAQGGGQGGQHKDPALPGLQSPWVWGGARPPGMPARLQEGSTEAGRLDCSGQDQAAQGGKTWFGLGV